MKNAWEPLRSVIEDEPELQSRLTEKKQKELKTRPSAAVVNYLNTRMIGRPTSSVERKHAFIQRTRNFSPNFLNQLKPIMTLWKSALSQEDLPLPSFPEIAMIGRSNTGKSTLINALCGRGRALVSSTPGSTKALDFYKIGKPPSLCLVDLPGYGYAVASEAERIQWTEFSLYYLKTRKNLKRVYMLIDARWGLLDTDIEMLAFLGRNNIKWQIILTKSDLEKSDILARRITCIEEEIKDLWGKSGPVIPLSAKRKQGLQDLRLSIDRFKINSKVHTDLFDARRMSKVAAAAATTTTTTTSEASQDTFSKWGLTDQPKIERVNDPQLEEGVVDYEDFATPEEVKSGKRTVKDFDLKKMIPDLKKAKSLIHSEIVGFNQSEKSSSNVRKARKPTKLAVEMKKQSLQSTPIPKGIAKWRVVGRPDKNISRTRSSLLVDDLVKVKDDKKIKEKEELLKWAKKRKIEVVDKQSLRAPSRKEGVLRKEKKNHGVHNKWTEKILNQKKDSIQSKPPPRMGRIKTNNL
jgi:ribosome biogenesis GTP-binding protein YsxC/EngB